MKQGVQRGKCCTVKTPHCALGTEEEAFLSNHGSAQLCLAARQGLAFLQCHAGSRAQREQSSTKQNFVLMFPLSEIWFPIMTWFPFPELAPASLCQPFKMFDHMAAQSCTISQSLQVRKGTVSNCCQQILSHYFPCLSCHRYRCQPGFFTASFFSSTLKKKKVGGKSKKEGLCISSAQALKWKNEGNSLLVLADPSTPTVTPLQPFEHDKMSSPGLIMQATNSSSRQGGAWVPGLYNLGLPAFGFVSLYRGKHLGIFALKMDLIFLLAVC